MVECPPPHTFAAFIDGGLDVAARDRVESHVDVCTACRLMLSELGRKASTQKASARPVVRATFGEQLGRYEVVAELGAGVIPSKSP